MSSKSYERSGNDEKRLKRFANVSADVANTGGSEAVAKEVSGGGRDLRASAAV
jgi:hypothetical protein